MEEKKTFYASYRGYVSLYTPIQADSEEEAYSMLADMPFEPTRELNLVMPTSVLDFELCEDYVESEQSFNEWSNRATNTPELEKAVVESAVTQGELRAEVLKKSKISTLSKQIDIANAQLLTVTKGITDQIDKLKLEMLELKG